VGSSKNDNKLRGEKAMIKENDRVKTLVEKEGFYAGESIPVNQKLSDIFLQLHISEQSGRGVPKITEVYGENAFEFRENSIVVTLLYAGYAINLL
jgi:predicted HTH transcriptional regulator